MNKDDMMVKKIIGLSLLMMVIGACTSQGDNGMDVNPVLQTSHTGGQDAATFAAKTY